MADHRDIVARLVGPLAPVLPAFTDDEGLDLDATCRWVEWVVASGTPMLWLTPGTTRYFSLSDEEVWELTRAVAGVTRGRAILIAATNLHWPVHQCRRYVEHAAECGADVVKVSANWLAGPSQDAVLEYYRAIAVDSPLPLFAYTLTPTGGRGMSTELLRRILDLPEYVGMKNDSGDFYEHRDYLAAIREKGAKFAAMTGGSMMSFLWGYDFGARAFCSAFGAFAPEIPIEFHEHLVAGRRDRALEVVTKYEEPLIDGWSAAGGWAAIRAILVFKGFFSSWQERFPQPTLTADQAESARDHLARHGLL